MYIFSPVVFSLVPKCLYHYCVSIQVRIHKFLEKTKKKKADKDKDEEGASGSVVKQQEKLRKKVTTLIKQQKLPAVRYIVKGQDDSKPWGQEAKAKVYKMNIQF